MNRSGQSGADFLDWFPRLIVLVIAVIVIALLVRHYSNRDVDAANISIAAHQYRLFYGDVIMYQDETTKRLYPGTVDLQKFSSERLAEVFHASARISSCLAVASQECPQFDETICFNQNLYTLHMAQSSLVGEGGASVQSTAYPVILKDRERTCTGRLNMTIVRPNR